MAKPKKTKPMQPWEIRFLVQNSVPTPDGYVDHEGIRLGRHMTVYQRGSRSYSNEHETDRVMWTRKLYSPREICRLEAYRTRARKAYYAYSRSTWMGLVERYKSFNAKTITGKYGDGIMRFERYDGHGEFSITHNWLELKPGDLDQKIVLAFALEAEQKWVDDYFVREKRCRVLGTRSRDFESAFELALYSYAKGHHPKLNQWRDAYSVAGVIVQFTINGREYIAGHPALRAENSGFCLLHEPDDVLARYTLDPQVDEDVPSHPYDRNYQIITDDDEDPTEAELKEEVVFSEESLP